MNLTPKQLEMLRACEREPQSSWSFGSGTVSSLRKLGLVRLELRYDVGMNVITDAGRAELESAAKATAHARGAMKRGGR